MAVLFSQNHRPLSWSLLSCTTALALCLVLPAQAQEAEGGFLGTILLDPDYVRARDPDGNAADRINSQYVADAELDRARMGDLKDLFSGIASVSVGGGIPIAQKIFVNGVDMLNLSVSVDGVAQNNRLFHHVSANAFDPGLLKSVRVDAGAAPADAGPNALAGAVVMETVDVADVLAEGQAVGGNARLSFGDNGETFGRALTLAAQHQGFEVLAYGKRATGEDYETGSGLVVEGSAADLTTGLLKLAYESDTGHRFELSGQRMIDDALRPFRANFIADGAPRPLRRYETERNTYGFAYENTQAAGLWDPRIVFGQSDVTIGLDQPSSPALGVSVGKTETLSGKVENRFHIGATDTVTVGVDFHDRTSSYRDDATAPITEESRNVGIYAQARLDPTEALSLSFGMRWDRQEFTGTSGFRGDYDGFSGNLSVAYDVTETLTLRAGVSSVFGGLSIEDNFIFNPAWTYDALEPARATNYTLGAVYDNGTLRVDGEVFMTQIEDARVSSFRANGNGDLETQGYNLGLGYGWQGGFLRASYSYSELEVNGAAADSFAALDLAAPLGGVLAIEVQHNPNGSDFTFGGSIEAAQKYEEIVGFADRAIPGYAVLNLFTEYRPSTIDGLVIRAAIDNVFDKEYADRATYGADFSSLTPLYEPGRTISVTAGFTF